MATFRCTARLLKRLKIGAPGDPPAPHNALGDWYANILYTRFGHYLVLVSERSRLPVLLSARELSSFPSRFLQSLAGLLGDIGVPSHQVDRELEAMQPFYFGKTANRSVLGTLNETVFMAREWLAPGDLSLYDVNLRLAQAPCLPLESKFPDKETRRLLANPRGFKVVGGWSA
nr:putative integron gene cassette protein [uncultured bacterium]